MRTRHTLIQGLLLAGLTFVLAACGTRAPAAPTVNATAPDFTLPTLDGTSVQLSTFKNKVVIVNFWASWCPPCVAETPRLVQWQATYGGDGLQVLGVDTLYQDSRADVEAFTGKNNVQYPILLDEVGDVSRQWQARNLPMSYIIDRQGVIRYTKLGELTERDFEQQIAPLLQAQE